MKYVILAAVFGTSFPSLAVSSDPNVQPYMDKEWRNAKCRFHVLVADGAYGNHEALSLEGCVASAEIGLLEMASSQADEFRFHQPAKVEFIDESGAKHVCQLQSKKEKFDRLQFSVRANQPGYYDSISPSLKRILSENFEVSCQTPAT